MKEKRQRRKRQPHDMPLDAAGSHISLGGSFHKKAPLRISDSQYTRFSPVFQRQVSDLPGIIFDSTELI